MNQNEWMNDPLVSHIDKDKLEFLQNIFFEGKKMTKEQMLPFLLAVAKKGQDKNISFSDEEIEVIVTALKKYASPEDVDKINKMMLLRKK